MTVIHINDLSLRIGKKQLLDSVSISIKAGERVAIVGPNGAGKTTLLKCLLGLIPNNHDSVQIQNVKIAELSRQDIARTMGYVPQQLSEEIPFTVLEFIMMSRYSHATGGILPSDPEGERIAKQVTQRLDIQHLENQSMSTLSGGERQKINLAAALAKDTPILILDEPAAHLDPAQRDSIQQTLREIGHSNKKTILAVTHDLNWAATDFDRIIGMANGQIIADAPPAEFITSENLHHIFRSTWSIHPHPESGLPVVLPTHQSD